MKALSVKELIEALKKLPEDLPVWSEGCDCSGEVGAAEIQMWDDEKVVFLRRVNSYDFKYK